MKPWIAIFAIVLAFVSAFGLGLTLGAMDRHVIESGTTPTAQDSLLPNGRAITEDEFLKGFMMGREELGRKCMDMDSMRLRAEYLRGYLARMEGK